MTKKFTSAGILFLTYALSLVLSFLFLDLFRLDYYRFPIVTITTITKIIIYLAIIIIFGILAIKQKFYTKLYIVFILFTLIYPALF